jgi:hypothetical protein
VGGHAALPHISRRTSISRTTTGLPVLRTARSAPPRIARWIADVGTPSAHAACRSDRVADLPTTSVAEFMITVSLFFGGRLTGSQAVATK